MARPVTITNEQILEAARRVFLERGYTANTAEIARAAGVSEGTLFKRYETKDVLFYAALGLPKSAPWVDNLQNRVGKGDVRTQLRDLAFELIAFFRDLLPRLTMMWSCRVPPSQRPPKHGVHPAERGTQAIAEYLAAEVRLQRLRACDPNVMVRMFTGAVYHFVMMEIMGMHMAAVPMSAESFVHGLVDTLWQGLRPEA